MSGRGRSYKDRPDMRKEALATVVIYQGSTFIQKFHAFKAENDKVKAGRENLDWLIKKMTDRLMANKAYQRWSIMVVFDNQYRQYPQPILKMYEKTPQGVEEINPNRYERELARLYAKMDSHG